jgi:hypothetical protein
MITILHGEHLVQSRDSLTKLLDAARSSGRQVTHLEGKKIDNATLQNALRSQSLFAEPRTLVIEELHSLPKSKKKDELISILVEEGTQSELEVILWEKKQLGVTELKKFPTAKVQVFTPTRAMFAWLNAVSGQQTDSNRAKMISLLRSALDSDGEQFCFAMLVRQIRLLMETKEAGPGNAAQPRMTSQARSFSWPQLFWLHKQLFLIDQAQKNSSTTFRLSSQLELLFSSL